MKLWWWLPILAACDQNPSRLDAVPHAAAAPAGDVEGRLARVEQKLDKIAEAIEQAAPAEPDPDATYAIAIDPHDPQEGPADAKVTIVEGFEFLCPFCYQVNPVVDQILAKYPKDVRVVSKYLVIHGQPAIAPGIAACAAAKQGKFKEMKAALWGHLFKQGAEGPEFQRDQLAQLAAIAASAGVDTGKLEAAADDCSAWLHASATAFKPLGVSGTPAFFVNGRYAAGALPFDEFDRLVAGELAKVDHAVAGGASLAGYYDREIVGKGLAKVKGRFED